MRYIIYRIREKKCEECMSFSFKNEKKFIKLLLFLNKYVEGKSSDIVYNNMKEIIIQFKINEIRYNKSYDYIHILYQIRNLAHKNKKYKKCYFVSNYNQSMLDNTWIISDNKKHVKLCFNSNLNHKIQNKKTQIILNKNNLRRTVSLPNMVYEKDVNIAISEKKEQNKNKKSLRLYILIYMFNMYQTNIGYIISMYYYLFKKNN